MEKDSFVTTLRDMTSALKRLRKTVKDHSGRQIRKKDIKEEMERNASVWFELIEPSLRRGFDLPPEIVDPYHDNFGKLLEYSQAYYAKKTILGLLDQILKKFSSDVLLPVQKHMGPTTKSAQLDHLLEDLDEPEKFFLEEAINCFNSGYRRASIVLGWSAAVNRLHSIVEINGIDEFSKASKQMANINTGRYKRFNKKFDLHNRSELEMSVFDNDLLWVLEFMNVVDGNEHERLNICLTMRNTAAHPASTGVSEENVLSFFSDLHTLVFSKQKPT